MTTQVDKHLLRINTQNMSKKPLLKKYIKGLKNTAGRNNTGQITVRHKGGGHKQKYRVINFCQAKPFSGITCSIEYDPNRKANIAAIHEFSTKKFLYILAPKNLKIGDVVKSSNAAEPKLGHSLPLSQIPVGTYIHNVSTRKAAPGQISRAAGTFSKLKEKTLTSATIQLSSGETKTISSQCYATIGIVSNEVTSLIKLKKAGQARWLNKRPTVRGVAMNPVDHPHGGGEGKKSGCNKTPWGKIKRSQKKFKS